MSSGKFATVMFWLVVMAGFLVLATLPVSMQAQLVTGVFVVVIMIVIKELKAEGPWRQLALALGLTVVGRYVYWRTTQTLPPTNQLQNFIPGVLLYGAEMYNVLMLLLSLFVVASPLKPREAPKPTRWPSVDIFVPTYNEDAGLLANTLAAAKALDYPGDRLNVWLLDDGGTDQKCQSADLLVSRTAIARRAELSALCQELGVHYLARPRNEHAKAGNLNYGLEHSSGELIAVFDADHAPAREFLRETTGYFEQDDKLFLVQTPHFFINPDPLERNLRTFDFMPSENEMFYGIIQRGLDKWNAAFFCGSAAVLRRAALATTHGFKGSSITEDCETALALHAAGGTSVYVDKPLIAGLQPATFASFIGQRSRWAQGMMQILMFHFPPLKRGLTLAQRLCYMSSTLFWLFPLSRMIFLLAPLCYLFLGLEIFSASGTEFLAYIMTYMMANLMLQNYLYGSFRWPWISELYEYAQSPHLLPAIVSVWFNPRKPTFRVTAKDEAIASSRLSEIGTPFFVIFALLVGGVIATVWRLYTEPYNADVALVVGGWNLLNLVLAGCALGVVSERADRQASRRVAVNRRCEFRLGDIWYEASLANVSTMGAGLHVFHQGAFEAPAGSTGEIRFRVHDGADDISVPVAVRRCHAQGNNLFIVGCEYKPTEPQHRRAIADLIFANSELWTSFQASRRHNPGVVRGTIWFVSLALYQMLRGLGYQISRRGGEPSRPRPFGGKSP